MRAPYQILTILYKRNEEKNLYCIFYRTSHPVWQFLSGGGEDDETPFETVVREVKEEICVNIKQEDIEKLDTINTIPVANVTGEYTWGPNVFVIPEYTFAVNATGFDITLSSEHKEYKWVEYEEAMSKLRYDSNKTALWELNEKLKRR